MSCIRSWCSVYVFFFKQKTAYEMRISDWSSDVCSSDLSATRAELSGPQTALMRLMKCCRLVPVIGFPFGCGPAGPGWRDPGKGRRPAYMAEDASVAVYLCMQRHIISRELRVGTDCVSTVSFSGSSFSLTQNHNNIIQT